VVPERHVFGACHPRWHWEVGGVEDALQAVLLAKRRAWVVGQAAPIKLPHCVGCTLAENQRHIRHLAGSAAPEGSWEPLLHPPVKQLQAPLSVLLVLPAGRCPLVKLLNDLRLVHLFAPLGGKLSNEGLCPAGFQPPLLHRSLWPPDLKSAAQVSTDPICGIEAPGSRLTGPMDHRQVSTDPFCVQQWRCHTCRANLGKRPKVPHHDSIVAAAERLVKLAQRQPPAEGHG
jgi:hypothetical protein